MSGQFLNITHRCVLPEIQAHYGPDTVWQCECGNLFRIYWNGDFEWRNLLPHEWNAEEQRVRTFAEMIVPTNIEPSKQKKPRFMGWR